MDRIQKNILHAVLMSTTWERLSLYQLCEDLEIDYSNAWYAARKLEAAGLLNITRPKGRDLCLSMSGLNRGKQPMETNDHPAAKYQRPNVPVELQPKLSRAALRINAITDQRLRLIKIAAIVAENARLLAEVNDHRAARGFELLPVYDPDKGGIRNE